MEEEILMVAESHFNKLVRDVKRYRTALEEIRNFTEDPASEIVAGNALTDA